MKMVKVILAGLMALGISSDAWGMDDSYRFRSAAHAPAQNPAALFTGNIPNFVFQGDPNGQPGFFASCSNFFNEVIKYLTYKTPFLQKADTGNLSLENLIIQENVKRKLTQIGNMLGRGRGTTNSNCILLNGVDHNEQFLIAQALAHYTAHNLYILNTAALLAAIEKRDPTIISSLFKEIKKVDEESIIIIPAVHTLSSKWHAGQKGSGYQEIFETTLIDNLKSLQRSHTDIFFVMTTNSHDLIHPNLLRLCIPWKIDLPLPNANIRKNIMQFHAQASEARFPSDELLTHYIAQTSGWERSALSTLIDKSIELAQCEAPDAESLIISETHLKTVFDMLKSIELQAFEKPKSIALNSLILPASLKTEMQSIINALKTRKTVSAKKTSLLLYGIPGTGKTELANAIAHEAGARIINILGSDVVNEFQGSGNKKIKAIFSKAVNCTSPLVIFIDEIDLLATQRRADKTDDYDRTMGTLWAFISKCATSCPNILIIGATNRAEGLDGSVRRRFVVKKEIKVPDYNARKSIVIKEVHAQGSSILMHVKEHVASYTGAKSITPGWTGHELKQLVHKAIEKLARDEQREHLNKSDFDSSFKDIRSNFEESELGRRLAKQLQETSKSIWDSLKQGAGSGARMLGQYVVIGGTRAGLKYLGARVPVLQPVTNGADWLLQYGGLMDGVRRGQNSNNPQPSTSSAPTGQ